MASTHPIDRDRGRQDPVAGADSSEILHADHVDLLVSAAQAYGLVMSRTSAALAVHAPPSSALVAGPDEVGELLLDEHLSALRHRAARDRQTRCVPERAVPGRAVPGRCSERLWWPDTPYRHSPVHQIRPLEVIKAVHGYERMAQASPGWAGGTARRLCVDLERSALQRLTGYQEAPALWRRDLDRPGPPIGLSRDWRPDVAGVDWISPSDLHRRWAGACAVLVTTEALPDVLPDLPARPEVYAISRDQVVESQWPQIQRLSPDLLVMMPSGGAWLAARLRELRSVPDQPAGGAGSSTGGASGAGLGATS